MPSGTPPRGKRAYHNAYYGGSLIDVYDGSFQKNDLIIFYHSDPYYRDNNLPVPAENWARYVHFAVSLNLFTKSGEELMIEKVGPGLPLRIDTLERIKNRICRQSRTSDGRFVIPDVKRKRYNKHGVFRL